MAKSQLTAGYKAILKFYHPVESTQGKVLIIPVKKLTLITLKGYEVPILRRLGELGVIQPKKIEKDLREFAKAQTEKVEEVYEMSDRLIWMWREISRLTSEEGRRRREIIQALINLSGARYFIEKMWSSVLELRVEDLAGVEAEGIRARLERLREEVRAIEENLMRTLEGPAEPLREKPSRIKLLAELRKEAVGLLDELGLGAEAGHEELNVEEASTTLRRLSEEYHLIKSQLEKLMKEVEGLERIRALLAELERLGVKDLSVGEFENLSVVSGLVPRGRVEEAREIISGKPAVVEEKWLADGRAFLTIACLKEYTRVLLNQLRPIGFEDLSDELKGLGDNVSEALKLVTKALEDHQAKLRALFDQLEEFKKKNMRKLASLARTLELHLKIEEILVNTARSENLRVIQGWIPADKIDQLSSELESLRKEFKGSFAFYFEDPKPDEEVPTILKNPKLFKIFESVVTQFGWPGHGEVDPTVVSGILWTLMFGLMFPDLGQGLVIAVIGAFLAHAHKGDFLGMNSKKVGKLIIWLGFSAAIFGLIFGEVFLMEFQPLVPGLRLGWLEDPSGVLWLIKVAIFFGVAQIILAMSLAAWNELRNGEIIDAVLSHHGLAGIIAFIGFILTAFHFLGISVIPGVLEFPELGMNTLKAWPFFLMLAGFIMMALKPVVAKESISLGLGNILEAATAFPANTFSYARIAGFAIVHAALAMVVHRMMHANPLMGIGMGLVFLNLFALSIELLVCMIQALRLLYYEFYSKFYKGMGTPYKPWKIS
ncbi:MAG: hypothetical protein DRJ69_00760 [Thermoprotei archaeon]|nr:MAG: hypothetical protein DRJ69_00760 [Thermoprotei archaeon]